MKMKDFFMEIHDEHISEYMARHPKVDYGAAYNATFDEACDLMVSKMAFIKVDSAESVC